MRNRWILVSLLVGIVGGARDAGAVPAFARKYKTSCETCHTIFPKLTPFGEQFRRNGYRFPGIDSDNVKADGVPLGTDAQKKEFPEAVWPGTITSFPPLALGANGQAIMHPDTHSSAGQADNGAVFNTDTLIEEAHLWAAGGFDDKITYFGELTFSSDGVELEQAHLHFNDIVGPPHAVNIAAGKMSGTMTSFGPHSTYVADMALPMVPVMGLYGATSDPFIFGDNHNGIEVNGVLGSRFGYAAGIAAGTNLDYRNSANVYAHAGYKLGGSTMDGENTDGTPQDLEHEQSITLDAFAYRSISRFTDPAMDLVKDTALTVGGSIRAQYAEFELNSGLYVQSDDHVMTGMPTVTTYASWNEASWLAYPWLVLAARFDYLRVTPDGMNTVNDMKITPGVAALVRPNLKLTLVAPIERANGAPDGGWAAVDGLSAAPTTSNIVGPEVESVEVGLWTAF